MAKKILKVLVILVLLIVLGIGGMFGWMKYEQSKYAATAVPFIQKVVPEIAQWNSEVFKSYMVPEALTAMPDADLTKLVNWLKKLGSLQSLGEPSFVHVFKGVNLLSGGQTIITYTIPAKFDAGDATITMRLLDQGKSFKIFHFNVNSKALIG